MALRIFKHMRAGLEATPGTGVAMTRGIPFTDGTHNSEVETIHPEELRNSYEVHYQADAGAETHSFDIGGPVGYNYLVWWLNVHMKAVASGSGGGADKTWTFTPTLTSDDIKTATVQFGYSDSISATKPAYSLDWVKGTELTLTWEKAPGTTGVTFQSHLISPEAAAEISAFSGTGTFTTEAGGLVKANNTQTFIDTSTIGTTADNYILSASWTLTNEHVLLYTLNNLTSAQELLRPNPMLWTATFRRRYINDTEYNAYVAKTVRKVRVRSLGPVLGASNYKVDLDLYGVWSGYTRTEVDGVGVEELTMVQKYDTTATTSVSLVVVNDQASIT